MKAKRLYDFCANSAKKFGGKPSDYHSVHSLIMDLCTTTSSLSGRAAVHCREFMAFVLSHLLGRSTLTNTEEVTVSVQEIGEEHLRFLYGFVPTKARWRNAKIYEEWFDGVDGCLRNYSRNPGIETPRNPAGGTARKNRRGSAVESRQVVYPGLNPKRFGVADL